jgi:hypothetical protein
MSSDENHEEDLTNVEAELASLVPRRDRVDPNWGLFLAARAFQNTSPVALPRRQRLIAWLWPCATAASLLLATTFGLLWAAGGKPQIIERVVYVSAKSSPATFDFPPVAALPPSPDSPWENRRLCRLILDKGIDALPELNSRSTSDTPAVPRRETYRDLLNQFLNAPTS